MNKLLLVLLLTASNVYSAELMANFSTGTIVITDTICPLAALVDDHPYKGYVVDKGNVTDACWSRVGNSKSPMIFFIEKVGKDRYEYNKIESKFFK